MLDRETFERIKERHGRYASWAVWAEPTDTTKLNMGDLTVLDPDKNPMLLQILRNDVVMVGLNVSKEFPEPAPFRNFHYAGDCQDYKTRHAVAGTAYWGAYMTDLIKDLPMLQSQALTRYLAENPSSVKENVQKLLAEFKDLRSSRPTILTFGSYTRRLFCDYFPRDKYSGLIPLRHYSDYISAANYRREFLSRTQAPTATC
jgi:hypothetical protein